MILIALGANLPSTYGPPEQSIEIAQRLIGERGMNILKCSSIWNTAPVPASDQPWYKNAVLSAHSTLTAQQVLDVLKAIEADLGREEGLERNASRIIDLDLLAYGNHMMDHTWLSLPHPRMHQRGFVLYPLAEVAPSWVHPVLGLTVEQMIEKLPADQRLKAPKTEAPETVAA